MAFMNDRGPRHFSMLRSLHLADAFTLANGFLGTAAVLSFMRFTIDHREGFFWLAHSAVAGGAGDGCARRAHCTAAGHGVAARARARFARRRHLLRRRAGDARVRRRSAGRLGPARPDLLRLLRHQPARALQRLPSAAAATAGKVAYFEGFPIPRSLLLVACWPGSPGWRTGRPAPLRRRRLRRRDAPSARAGSSASTAAR